MVALSPVTSDTSYTEPSPYGWLRSRASVPTSYAPACEPLSEFADVLKNRTSRARGVAVSCTGVVIVRLEAASSYVIVFWEVQTIFYNGESIDARTGLYNFRARWYSASNGRFERLDPYAGNPSDPFSFNKYGFVHGNPVMGVDPTGRSLLGGFGGFAVSIGIRVQAIAFVAAPILANAAIFSAKIFFASLAVGLAEHFLFGQVSEFTKFVMDTSFAAFTLFSFLFGIALSAQTIPGFSNVSVGGSRSVTNPGTGRDVPIMKDNLDGRKLGFNAAAPKYYSVPNKQGGRVWVSNDKVTQSDFKPLVNSNSSGGRTVILTGTHGGPEGGFGYTGRNSYRDGRDFLDEDLAAFGRVPGVDVVDVMKLTNQELDNVLNGTNKVIVAWCDAERAQRIIKILMGTQ